MAAYETALTNPGYKMVGQGIARTPVIIAAIIAATTAMIDNADDDTGCFWVPKGFVVTAAVLSTTALAASALVLDLGDAADEDRLIAASTVGVAGGLVTTLAYSGHLYKFTADTKVRVYIKTAATTPAAGTVKVHLEGFIDENFSTTALVAA